MDDEELEHRLNLSKDTLIQEHNLPQITQVRSTQEQIHYNRKKDSFEKKANEKTVDESEDHIEDNHNPVLGKDDVGSIPIEPAFLLVYEAADTGQIMRIQTLGSPTQVSAVGKQFMANTTQ